MTVPNGSGGVDRWAFEGMSPNHLVRNGWSRKTLKSGDKITLGYYNLKDGRKGGFNVSVTFADGKTIRQLEAPTVIPPTTNKPAQQPQQERPRSDGTAAFFSFRTRQRLYFNVKPTSRGRPRTTLSMLRVGALSGVGGPPASRSRRRSVAHRSRRFCRTDC